VKKTHGRAFVTQTQLKTIVVEIEAMLNNGPLTYVSSDLSDPEPDTCRHVIWQKDTVNSISFGGS